MTITASTVVSLYRKWCASGCPLNCSGAVSPIVSLHELATDTWPRRWLPSWDKHGATSSNWKGCSGGGAHAVRRGGSLPVRTQSPRKTVSMPCTCHAGNTQTTRPSGACSAFPAQHGSNHPPSRGPRRSSRPAPAKSSHSSCGRARPSPVDVVRPEATRAGEGASVSSSPTSRHGHVPTDDVTPTQKHARALLQRSSRCSARCSAPRVHAGLGTRQVRGALAEGLQEDRDR